MAESVINYKKREIRKEENTQSEEIVDLCDASTVENLSFANKPKRRKTNKHTKTTCEDKTVDSNIKVTGTDDPFGRLEKVENWLEYSCFGQNEDTRGIEESEWWVIQSWLNMDPMSQKKSTFISSHARRMKVFLMKVDPDPDNEPRDLVSGYCYTGCKGFYKFSNIHWEKTEQHIPKCPHCLKLDKNKELKLLFLFKLHVMDTNGKHGIFNLCKNEAETLLNCTVMEFVNVVKKRERRIQFLRETILFNSVHLDISPLLDISVVLVKNIFFVVNSSLITNK